MTHIVIVLPHDDEANHATIEQVDAAEDYLARLVDEGVIAPPVCFVGTGGYVLADVATAEQARELFGPRYPLHATITVLVRELYAGPEQGFAELRAAIRARAADLAARVVAADEATSRYLAEHA